MSTTGKRFTNLDADQMDALIGSPAQRYDEIAELWDTLLLQESELARAEVILSAMKALVVFIALPDSASAAAEATRHLNRLFEHEGDLGDQRLRQHQRQGGIGASLAHLWNSYLDLLEDPSIPRKK
ncbi:hypothetical protein ACFY4C_37150 [Actinomadura viridis]|uniref:hypothetical protein n=1 Tax=Actinomadura viridis TaxID=58110 RepID=UPI003673A0C8